LWDSIILHNMPGMFGSGAQSSSLTNFTGAAGDTVNCQYHWTFRKIDADSCGNTTNGGLTTIWLGGLAANEVFLNMEIYLSKFNYNPSPSPSGPACFIHAQNCFYLRIHDNTFSGLGVVVNPEGHAAAIFCQGSHFYIYHNFFGTANFGDCTRAISQGYLPAMTTLFTAWDPTYDGVSRWYGNIRDSGRKYPMFEDQKDTLGLSAFSAYYTTRRSARVWNNTMYRGGMGTGNSPYNVSAYDWYLVTGMADTLELNNTIEIGPPTDTVGNVCNSQACVALITRPNNGTPIYDTAGNSFAQLLTFANSGLLDTTTFKPIPGGSLAGGVSLPSWLTTDYYGNSYTGTIYKGAVQYIPTGGIPPDRFPVHSFRRKYVKD
jgi:hypothetical protein